MIDAEFADWFGIGGPPDYVVERLLELAELGIESFGVTLRPDEREPFADKVLAEVKRATA
jgi:hypothetical protein